MSATLRILGGFVLVALFTTIIAQDTTTQYSARGPCLNRPRPAGTHIHAFKVTHLVNYKNYLGYAARNPVKIAMSPWSSSFLNAHIASILLDEAIGVRNEIVEIDNGADAWDQMAQGKVHIILEYW